MNYPRPRASNGRTRIQTCFSQAWSMHFLLSVLSSSRGQRRILMCGAEKCRACALAWLEEKGSLSIILSPVAADCLVISQKPHSFLAVELFHSESFEMNFVTSQFYVNVISARFPWDPDLLDNLNINDSDNPGSPEKQRPLGGQWPHKANDSLDFSKETISGLV